MLSHKSEELCINRQQISRIIYESIKMVGRFLGSGSYRKCVTFFNQVTDFTVCGRKLLRSFVGLAKGKSSLE
jgi:glutamine amidotransferase-like uncharacterized protein